MKKLVIITGASSGIGEATAIKLSAEGYPLLLLARRVKRMEALNLPNCLCRAVDITDKESFKQAIEEAEETFGVVDCLINNAGVMLLDYAVQQDIEEWETMIDVNIKGLLYGIHNVLHGMVKRNTGTIINISSVAGRKTSKTRVVYCGTKFAVHAISEVLREEVAASNVRVSTVAPGVVETELLDHSRNQNIISKYKKWKESIGQGLYAHDIANTISFIYNQPQEVCIREVVIAPTKQQA